MGVQRRRRNLMLVTGGSGFLGRHLLSSRANSEWDLAAPSSSAVDVRQRASTIDEITRSKPSAVVHLAYNKGDRQSIVDGSRNVAEAAQACGARLVHISTDVVFPGRAAPYSEADRPSPTIDYGRDKADAEHAVMDECPTAVMVRTSLLYGTTDLGHVQLDVQRALDADSDIAGGTAPMTFFTDEYRSPVHAADVAAAITDLADWTDVVGPINIAGPHAVSRADFARATAQWMGFDSHRVRTGTMADAGLVRPARIVLDTSKATALGITCRSVAESYHP